MSGPRVRFCDDLGPRGFGWIVEEALARASHALADDGRVWLVDPVDWPPALERALELGEPAGVLQLLDRHGRDCAALAERLDVPLLVAPAEIPGSPFRSLPVVRRRVWREVALWWPQARTLVVADALGTNAFATGGADPPGVHLLLRLTPPRRLGELGAEHLLVGHGEGLHGPGTADAIRRALATSRRGL
ncbi:MAG TPA: hypothetical protein VNJ53_07135, partial [Gaiellaceae bacterium]|nr:hypothetical protein [Gaiellaceae bacterium]